jgi:hypothetical protein
MSLNHTEVAVKEMLKLDFRAEQIAQTLQLTVEQIQEIIDRLED